MNSLTNRIGVAVSHLVDSLFPPRCLACADPIASGHSQFCRACDDALQRERQLPYCPTCGDSLAPFELIADRCRQCRHRRPGIIATVRVGRHRDQLGDMIRAYKYDGAEHLGPILGRWMIDAIRSRSWCNEIEVVVAVPTHWRHRLKRRFYGPNQLAGMAAKSLRIPHVPLLQRVRAGPHQIGLSYSQRQQNIRGAFEITRGASISGATVLLVDDVKTTGATLEECAKVLHRAGAGRLYAAVVGKMPYDEVMVPVG